MLFPLEFQKALIGHPTIRDNASLERALKRRGYRLTKQFIGLMANGKRVADVGEAGFESGKDQCPGVSHRGPSLASTSVPRGAGHQPVHPGAAPVL